MATADVMATTRCTNAAGWRRWLPFLVLAVSVVPAGICLVAVLGQFPPGSEGTSQFLLRIRWLGEISCHWGAQAALALIPAQILWRRHRVVCSVLFLLQALGCAQLWMAAWEPRLPPPAAGAATITIAHANLNKWNPLPYRTQTVATVLATDADLIVLVESYRDHDQPGIDPLRWPVQQQVWAASPSRTWGDYVTVLSKFPIIRTRILDEDTQPTVQVTVDVHGRHLHLYAVHVPSPWRPRMLSWREQHLDTLRNDVPRLLAEDPAPVLLMGDFNLGVASPVWRELTSVTGVQRAGGVEPATWHRRFGPLGIAIDHLAGRDLAMEPVRSFPLLGSDHLGLTTRIALP